MSIPQWRAHHGNNNLLSSEHEQIKILLERHRSTLQDLPGVVGTGIGLSSPQDPESEVVIQVFVRSDEVVEEVTRRAAMLVGEDHVQVIISGDMTPLEP